MCKGCQGREKLIIDDEEELKRANAKFLGTENSRSVDKFVEAKIVRYEYCAAGF